MMQDQYRAFAAVGGVLAWATIGMAQDLTPAVCGSKPDDKMGIAVVAGDVNGDGVDDVIGGAYQANGQERGYVSVISGLDGEPIVTLFGQAAGDRFGRAVDFVGDVNGDGVGDVLVGAYQPFGFGPGYASVLSGLSGATLLSATGDAVGDNFGGAVAGGVDVNQDGSGDYLVGAPQRQTASGGYVRLYSGADGKVLHEWSSTEPGDMFGAAVTFMDDVDRDGHPELLIAAPRIDRPLARGYVACYSGADGQLLYRLDGDQLGDDFGTGLAATGDLDGDGYGDIVVGAPGASAVAQNAGYVRTFSGRDGSPRTTVNGSGAQSAFGFAVADVGDVNTDGASDLAIGAYGDSEAGALAGSVTVISGVTGATLTKFRGRSADDHLGISVGAIGDLDGDGFPELLAGAFREDAATLADSGCVYTLDTAPPTRPTMSPGSVLFDERLFFDDAGGPPGEQYLLAVVNVDGLDVFRPLAQGEFDDSGKFNEFVEVPVEVSGHRFTFRLYHDDHSGLTTWHDFLHVIE